MVPDPTHRAPLPALRASPPRADIEGLRAVAVVLVLAYHFFPTAVPGGYFGVDVFFVVSGYLITRSLLEARAGAASTRAWLLAFWARRFRRLMPNALSVLLAVSVAGIVLLSDFGMKRLGSDVFASALYSVNWLFVLRSIDYLAWDETQRSALLNFWSLAVEEQFYLFWPLMLSLLGVRAVGGDRRRLAGLVTATGLLSLAYMAWLASDNRTVAFFSTPARAWELLVGAALNLRGLGGQLVRLAAVRTGAVLAILACSLGLDDASPHPGWITLVPVSAAALLVLPPGPVSRPAGWGDRWLALRWMQVLGARSYSLYLWHWPVLVIGARLVPSPVPGRALVLLAFSALAAEMAYRWIETPARHRWGQHWSSRRVIGVALACSLGLACVGFALRAVSSVDVRELLGGQARGGTLALPSIQAVAADLPEVYANGCHLSLAATVSPPCIFGRADAEGPPVVLFGDSHAAQWFSPLDAVARSTGVRLLSWTKSGCPSVDASVWNAVAQSPFRACDTWREHTLQRIEALRPRWVVLSNLVEPVPALTDPANGRPLRGRAAMQAWAEGLERVIRRLQAAGIRVVLIRDTPRPRPDVLDCLYGASNDAVCEVGGAEALSIPALDLLAATRTGAVVWDFSGQICPASRCPVRLAAGPTVVYRDSNHLTDTFARTLQPALDGAWRALAAPPARGPAGR